MTKLKKYLTINAIFSVSTGLIMLLFSNSLNNLFAFKNVYIFPIIGANLLVFAAFVWYVSVKQLANKILVTTITVLDLLWVIGSFCIVFFEPSYIPKIGTIIICLIAIWIAFLAYKQYINSK